jgi:D-arabinose 1-dehydrogenase-like Zn-dependent alcohol dehydrogenase
MKAAVLYEYDPEVKAQLRVETVPEPTIQAPHEVIVRIGAAGLCRTDLHVIEGVFRGAMDPHGTLLPFILGHENAGWVEAVGTYAELRHLSGLPPGRRHVLRARHISGAGCQRRLCRVSVDQ